jgi:glycine cleavage system regulatory protein
MATFILSVTGSDRPGLTEALAGAVLAARGNWLESRLSQLGGLYVGSVLVELSPEGAEALRAAVARVDAQGLEVRVAPAVEAPAASGDLVHIALVGQDHPGIVHQVTALLSSLDANIEALDTRIAAEPHSGAPLFHMDARVRLPADRTMAAVQSLLEDISAEIMVDISLTPAPEG